ncbi:MAG: hypothetical protein J0I10_00125, partial [Verrucomicrobia bacterium]|nr:hypothetical protein [Verrucomicrobiota bacterium]
DQPIRAIFGSSRPPGSLRRRWTNSNNQPKHQKQGFGLTLHLVPISESGHCHSISEGKTASQSPKYNVSGAIARSLVPLFRTGGGEKWTTLGQQGGNPAEFLAFMRCQRSFGFWNQASFPEEGFSWAGWISPTFRHAEPKDRCFCG